MAQHWDLAGDVSQSVPAYIVAAQAAQSAASHTEARRLLDRALELAATMPEGDERDLTELMIRMQRTVSTSSLFGYGYPEVFEDFTIAEEICRRLTDRPEIMPAQVGIWSYLLVRGSVDAASVGARAPDRRARRSRDGLVRTRDQVVHGLRRVLPGQARRGAPLARRGVGGVPRAVGRRGGLAVLAPPARRRARSRRSRSPASPPCRACTEESALWERRALATAEELDFPSGPFSSAFVSVYLAWIRMITGNLDEARDVRTAHDGDRRTLPVRLLPAARQAVRPDARARPAL